MNEKAIAGVALVVSLGVCLGGLVMLPSLQNADEANRANASRELEKARRLLHKYSATVELAEGIRIELRNLNVDVDIEDEDTLLDNAGADYDDYVDRAQEEYPTKQRGVPNINQGIAERDKLVQENARLLDAALSAVNTATSTAPDLTEAHKLKAAIHYAKGLVGLREALASRALAEAKRHELSDLANIVEGLSSSTRIVEMSGIDDQIAVLESEIQRQESIVAGRAKAFADVEATIQNLKQRLKTAEAQAAEARSVVEEINEQGIDFASRENAEQFAKEYAQATMSYRQILRNVHALQRGSYPFAEMDITEDYTTAPYIENGSRENLTVSHGLSHFVDQWSVLSIELEKGQQALEQLGSHLADMKSARSQYATEEERNARAIEQSRANAKLVLNELFELETEAIEIENDALTQFNSSAGAARQASQSAQGWVRTAQEELQKVAAEAQDSSAYSARQDDRWLNGYAKAMEADAELAKAWIHYERYAAAKQNAVVFSSTAEILNLSVTEADPATELEFATEAYDDGLQAVQTALTTLKQAHGDTGSHWTLTAQAAGTTYVVSLFDKEGFARDALRAYRSAIEGRVDEPFAVPFNARIHYLEGR